MPISWAALRRNGLVDARCHPQRLVGRFICEARPVIFTVGGCRRLHIWHAEGEQVGRGDSKSTQLLRSIVVVVVAAIAQVLREKKVMRASCCGKRWTGLRAKGGVREGQRRPRRCKGQPAIHRSVAVERKDFAGSSSTD